MGEIQFSFSESKRSTDPLKHQDVEHDDDKDFDVYLKVTGDVPLKVKRTQTIRSIKEAFFSKTGVHENLQEVHFFGERLEDGKTVAGCGIQRDSTINLILNGFGKKLYIKVPSKGLTVVVMTEVHDTILHIKSIVSAKQEMGSEEFDLMYGGRFLESCQTLASVNIGSDSTLYLVPRPRDVMMSIQVLLPTKEIITLQVKPLQKMGDVKALVGSMTNLTTQHTLFFTLAEKLLSDSQTLAYYNINENSELELSEFLQFYVKVMCMETISLIVLPSDTVTSLNDRVAKELGISNKCNYVYYYNETRLDVEGALASYGILKNSTLEARIWRSLKCWLLVYFQILGNTFCFAVVAILLNCKKLLIPRTISPNCYTLARLHVSESFLLCIVNRISITDVISTE